MSKINEITPIKNGMSKEQAKQAIRPFLQEVLNAKNILSQEDIVNIEPKQSGVRSYKLITLKDGSQWVQGDKGIERLIGFSYLKKHLNLDKWDVVETKCFLCNKDKTSITVQIKKTDVEPLKNILTIGSKDFIACSKYVGDNKPESSLEIGQFKSVIQNSTGFRDFTFNANLRKQADGSIIIIDTEYASFSSLNAIPVSTDTDVELGGVEFSFSTEELLG